MSLIQQLESYIHPSYNEECKELLIQELNSLIPNLRKEYNTKTISPSNVDVMLRVLEQDPCNKKGIILGMDPYPYNATGIPFEDPAFKQMSNKNIASNIARIYDIDKGYITTCNLYNLSNSILLMNAALTVPLANKGERSNSGAHFELWKKFIQIILVYSLKNSPSCRFILVFGKSQHLSELADSVIAESESLAYKIISYHPCMATYFMRDDSNPFQEVNALLKLLEDDEIKWYKVFPEFSDVELVEKREIDIKNTFMHLSKNLVIQIGDMNSYEALLGDMELSIINKVLDNESTVLELSKIYNRSLTEFNLTVSKLLCSVAKPTTENVIGTMMENRVCGFIYSCGRVTIFIKGVSQTKGYLIDPLNFYFRERFSSRKVMGTFDLAITNEDSIPMNAYECLIELIYTEKVDYCLVEIITQLMRKIRPLSPENEAVISVMSVTVSHYSNLIYQHLTVSGFGYLSDTNGNNCSPKGLLQQGQAVTVVTDTDDTDDTVIMLRQLYDCAKDYKKLKEPNNRGLPDAIFSLLLYIEKDYTKALSMVKNFSSTDEVLRFYGVERLRELSPFHLAVSSVGALYPRAFQHELELRDGIIVSPTLSSKLIQLQNEEERMTSLLEFAKYKSGMIKKIEATQKAILELSNSKRIIQQINRILKYIRHDTDI